MRKNLAHETKLTPDKSKEIKEPIGQPFDASASPFSAKNNSDNRKTRADLIPDMIPIGSAAAESGINVTADEGPRSFISKGERVHKWGSYLGIDWIFNTLAGVSFAYWGNHTEMGQKLWSKPLTNEFTYALKPLIKNPEYLKASVAKGNLFMSIIAGGMFTIPPLMLLETNKNKRDITQWLDEKIYGKEAVENDPKFAKAYEEIMNEPKKDFASGMLSRGAALAPLLAMIMFTPTRKLTDKIYFDHVAKASESAANKLGFTAENSFKNVSREVANERWKFIHDGVAMDFGLGIPYAVLHAFFYNKFAGKCADKNSVSKEETLKDNLTATNTINAPIAETGFDNSPPTQSWTKKTKPAEKYDIATVKPGFAEKAAADKSTVEAHHI